MTDLRQALAQAYTRSDNAEIALAPLIQQMNSVNTNQFSRGHPGAIVDGLIDAFRRPGVEQRHGDALREAEAARRGIGDIEAQLQALAEYEEQQKLAALYREHGMGGAEAQLRSMGADVPERKDTRTTSQKNAEGMGLQPGTPEYNDYIRQSTGKAQTNINLPDNPQFGKVDPGMVMRRDESGGWYQEPVPGSQAAQEAERAGDREAFVQSFKRAGQNLILEEIEYAQGLLSGNTAGLPGAVGRVLPGSESVDFEAAIKPVLANLSFDRLQQMREMSTTGGALGQVSERELDLLQSTVAGYDPNMSEEAKGRFLEKVKRHYQNWYMAEIDGVDPYGDQVQPAGNLEAYQAWKAQRNQ